MNGGEERVSCPGDSTALTKILCQAMIAGAGERAAANQMPLVANWTHLTPSSN